MSLVLHQVKGVVGIAFLLVPLPFNESVQPHHHISAVWQGLAFSLSHCPPLQTPDHEYVPPYVNGVAGEVVDGSGEGSVVVIWSFLRLSSGVTICSGSLRGPRASVLLLFFFST